jgi:F0F1-type ATP synthase alpha subunit
MARPKKTPLERRASRLTLYLTPFELADLEAKTPMTPRIRAILKQPQHAPFRLADEVGLMLAVQSGLLDPLPLSAVAAFREGLPAALDKDAAEALRMIAETGELDAGARDDLMAAMTRLAASLDDAGNAGSGP